MDASGAFDWRWVFWISVAILLALLIQLLSPVLMPFLAGFVLAYLLNPIANRLEKAGFKRLGAVFLILFLFLCIAALVSMIIVPLLGRQLAGFIVQLPDYATKLQNLVSAQSDQLIQRFGGSFTHYFGISLDSVPNEFQKSLSDLTGQGTQALKSVIGSLWSGGAALVNLLSLMVITPVVTFYILVDWNRLIASLAGLVPIHHRRTVHLLAGQIDAALAGFLRGQALVCLFLALWYGIGLSLIGLNFGFLIGITGGLLSFIPYVGSLTVLVVATGVSVVQGWPEWNLLLLTLGVVFTGQFLEGNILSPELVGSSIGLHPVWLMFALLAFGYLFGFTGLMLAVPVSAAIGVILRFAVVRYRQSPLYLGAKADTAEKMCHESD